MSKDAFVRSKPGLGGRPPKFDEPSRPVTVTLPDRVLRLLASVDSDRAKAIVKLTDMALETSGAVGKCVEVVPVSSKKAVILVARSRYLCSIPWLRLVEVAPAKHLLSLRPGTSIEKLEVAINDLLDLVPESEPFEQDLLQRLLNCLRGLRRNQTMTKEEVLLVDVSPKKAGRVPQKLPPQ